MLCSRMLGLGSLALLDGVGGPLLKHRDDNAGLGVCILLSFPGLLVAPALVQSSILLGLKDYSRLLIHFL